MGAGPRRAAAGFSLIELIGILVILSMLASLTFVTWQAIVPRTELNSTVRALAATLHEARSDAIARNAEFTIEYYFEETPEHPRGYRVVTPFRREGGGLAAADEERLAHAWQPLPEGIVFRKIVLNGEERLTGQVIVRFDPLGGASDHSIVLEQVQFENLYTIEVLALTGLIRFHDGEFTRQAPEEGDFR
jgi:Tfp pilus assembly protein FimT